MWGDEGGWDARVRAAADKETPDQQARDRRFRERLKDARILGQASNGLPSSAPELSARGGITPGQEAGLWGLTGAVFVCALWEPEALLTVGSILAAGLFSTIIAIRLAAAISATLPKSGAQQAALPDAALPVLSILVPLYREANVVDALARALMALDYPKDRLEVKLVVEADDEDTIAALLEIDFPAWIEILPVPASEPRTKPKALNYGMAFVHGEMVAVFDAEDRPSPQQPRQAAAALMADPSLAVVQAPLLTHNGRQGWLAGQFQLEYAIHFLVWLPFLSRMGAPLPLGGTSNYFRRSDLVTVGGWDAWNVTEDADLGLRLARFGREAALIDAPTLEESPVRFRDWRAQRTRWIKGYLQTWFVLMRAPMNLLREYGLGKFVLLQITFGGSLLAALLHGPILAWMLFAALTPFADIERWHMALLGSGYGSVVFAAIASRQTLNASAVLSVFLYWPLLSWATLCAIWELKRRPHFWAKTPHGVSPPPA